MYTRRVRLASPACLLVLTLGLTACSESEPTGRMGPPGPDGPPCAAARFAPGRLGVQCAELVDAEGRVVLLHGVNARVDGVFDVTFDDGRTALEPIPAFPLADAQRMRAIGFNALRLPINWSGLEPSEDGGFDEGYLDRVEAAVATAHAGGLRVLLDFHQDAYSKEIGEDGAPLWAIVPPPTELLEGPLTDLDVRRASAQVLAAFATFFGDSADGARLRTRFAAAVAHVAARFAGDDRVLGIEILNEPLAGSASELYRLYDEVIAAARAADPDRILVFEPDVQRNFFDHAPIRPKDRAPWPGTAYAPHVYTLAFTGTDAQKQAMTKESLAFSNENAANEATSWEAPLVITEFGYDPQGLRADDYIHFQTELQDEHRASAFYWVWKEQSQGSWGVFDYDAASGQWTERAAARRALARVTAEAIAGWNAQYGYDRAGKRFELAFDGDSAIVAPNLLYVPEAADFAAAFTVSCDGAALQAARDPATGLVAVPCNGPGRHAIVLAGQ